MLKFKLLKDVYFLLLYLSTFHSHSAQAPPANFSDLSNSSDISESDMESNKFLPPKDILKNCSTSLTFCEQVPDSAYPSDIILAEKENLEPLGDDVVEEGLQKKMGADDYDEANESSDSTESFDEFPMCPSIERVVYPKVGKTKNKDILFILNHEEFLQGIQIETCVHKRKQCAFTETVPWGYKTFCRQKYVYKKLVALNGKGKAQPDIFLFPSCCVCIIRLDHSFSSKTDSKRRL